jgi:hypothetical protein
MNMKRIMAFAVLSLVLVVQLPVLAQDTKKEAPKVAVKVPAKAVVAASQPVAVTPAMQPVAATTVASQPAAAVPLDPTLAAPWWKVLLRYGLELIFTILGLLASVFVTVLMKKYGFEDYTARINELLTKSIGFAEQKSSQALKLNGQPLGSAEKLALALELIAEKAKEYKLPDKGKEWWTKKVEGWLGSQKVTIK